MTGPSEPIPPAEHGANSRDLPPPPPLLLPSGDQGASNAPPCALFLDFDGTLVDIADHPDDVLVPKGLPALLTTVERRLDGRLAIVTGRSIAALEAHYRDHWAVTAYAAALGTTASTLTRATRALTGQALVDLLHDRLLLEAKRNLAFTGASVAQIAYALGFADPAYFARFFKARSGQTASSFRRNLVWPDSDGRDREAR